MTEYFILGENGLTYFVDVEGDSLKVFETTNEEGEVDKTGKWKIAVEKFKKLFPGIDRMYNRDGNSLLVSLGDKKYLHIGSVIYSFVTDDEITEYYSPVGNSSVSYPYAVSKKHIYLLTDFVKISSDIGTNDNGYWSHECIDLNTEDRKGKSTDHPTDYDHKTAAIFHPYNMFYKHSELPDHCQFDIDPEKFEVDMVGESPREFKKKTLVVDSLEKKTEYVSRGGYIWYK